MMRQRVSHAIRWRVGERIIALFLLVFGIVLVALAQVPETTPVNDQLKIKQKQLYAEAHSYVEESPTKLKKDVRELKGLEPVPSQDSLSELLSKIGAEADGLLQRMPDLISEEEVTESIVGTGGATTAGCTGINCSLPSNSGSKTTKFDYLILRHSGEQDLRFEEYRSGRNGKALPAGSESMRFRGFVGAWLIFTSSNQVESRFRYLGQQQMNGHDTFVIGFSQIPGSVESPGRILSGNTEILMLLQGIAWIDKSDCRIVRIRTDLLAPRPEAGLQKQTANIEFGPVQIVATTNMDLWLPHAVAIEMQGPDSLVFEQHKYSRYRLYQVKSKMLSPEN